MLINCDIGERGSGNEIDLELLQYIDLANIACGGHAGERASAEHFYKRSQESGIQVSLHLSYPDRENFGRISIDIENDKLLAELSSQRSLLPEVDILKFHGALYHDSAYSQELAKRMAHWAAQERISTLLTPPGSHFAEEAKKNGIKVWYEGFIDRRYVLDERSNRLVLMDRTYPEATLSTVEEGLKQEELIAHQKQVEAYLLDPSGDVTAETVRASLQVETLCIHSDSPIALALAKQLAQKRGRGKNA